MGKGPESLSDAPTPRYEGRTLSGSPDERATEGAPPVRTLEPTFPGGLRTITPKTIQAPRQERPAETEPEGALKKTFRALKRAMSWPNS